MSRKKNVPIHIFDSVAGISHKVLAPRTAAGMPGTAYSKNARMLMSLRQRITREMLPTMAAIAITGIAVFGPKVYVSAGNNMMELPVPTMPLITPASMPVRAITTYITSYFLFSGGMRAMIAFRKWRNP